MYYSINLSKKEDWDCLSRWIFCLSLPFGKSNGKPFTGKYIDTMYGTFILNIFGFQIYWSL